MSRGTIMRELRDEYHRRILREVLRFDSKKGAWNNTDTGSDESIRISAAIVEMICANTGASAGTNKIHVQRTGYEFEKATMSFIQNAFTQILHLRPGQWDFSGGGKISRFDQYEHLPAIKRVLKNEPALRAVLGDYIVTPDIVMSRNPEPDKAINTGRRNIVDDDGDIAGKTPLRQCNAQLPILHATISCKWTLRSDRAQNVRTEGLNLIRNRKGGTPRIVAVVGEPLPSRLTPLVFGTGDIDCVYHFALPELQKAAGENSDMIDMLVKSRRLRDICDLVFDLAI